MKNTSFVRSILVLLIFIALISCSSGGGDNNKVNDNTHQNPETIILPPEPDGVVLTGSDADDARAATVTLAPSPAPADEIEGVLLKSRLAAVIAPGATVGEVNAALQANNAAIVSMIATDPYVTLVIDPVTDRAQAQAKANALVASGAFIYARPGFTRHPQESPAVMPSATWFRPMMLPEPDAVQNVAHLTPGRVPATWNVRSRAITQVNLLAPDWYKENLTYIEIPQLQFSPYGGAAIALDNTFSYRLSNRGIHHLGVAAANMDFDSGISPHTGADPVAEQLLDVMAMHTYGLDIADMLHALVLSIDVSSPTVVLSVDTFEDPDGTAFSYLDRAWLALKWRRLVHTVQGGPDFVHIVAAGNSAELATSNSALNTASLNSVFGIASGPDLVGVAVLDAFDQLAAFQSAYDAEVAAIPAIEQPLDNVLLVGSSDASGNASTFSTPGAHVRTVGEFVTGPCVLVSPYCSGVSEQRHESGAAAAQVAGIAAYLWHFDNGVSVSELLLRLQHAYSASGTPGILDAWIAVLSVDRSLTMADAQLRIELLDVSGPSGQPNGEFTEHDIDAFLTAFDAFNGAIAPDWSVYDLNGDGWTAGVNGARMDLDINVLPGFGNVTQQVGSINKSFDETNVTDQEVLCYYAWSPLYTGDTARRAAIPGCGTNVSVEHIRLTTELRARTLETEDVQLVVDEPVGNREVNVAQQTNPVNTDVSIEEIAHGMVVWNEEYDPTSLSLSRFSYRFDGSAAVSITGTHAGHFGYADAHDITAITFLVTEPVTITITGMGNGDVGVGGGNNFTTGIHLSTTNTGAELYVVSETLPVVPINYTAQLQPGRYSLQMQGGVELNSSYNDTGDVVEIAEGSLEVTVTFTP